MKEYAIYPFSVMNITQNYDDGNHVPHWKNVTNYSDKPWDEACKDSGRSYFEPQNDFIIEEVIGIDSLYTNTVRLKSVNKLHTPFKEEADYLYLTLTHMNEDNLKQVQKGNILKKGSKVLLEGTDGNATGNHFHITANFGKYYGCKENNNGKWCYTYEKSLLPHEAFYIDPNFTTIKKSNGSTFKEKPIDKIGTPVSRNDKVDQIEILVDNLNARNGASKNCKKLGYINKGIYNYISKTEKEGYVWYQVEKGIYIASNGEWCKELAKVVEKDTSKEEIELLKKQIEELKTTIESNNSLIKGFEATIEVAEETIKEKDSEISAKDTQIQELEARVEELFSKEEIMPKMVYKAPKTRTYKIMLKENEELYIK